MVGKEHSLLIVCAGGLGQDAAEIAAMTGLFSKIAYIDDFTQDDNSLDYPVVGKMADLERMLDAYDYAIAALGNNQERMKIHEKLQTIGYHIPVLVHSTSYVHEKAILEPGTIVRAMSYVGRNVRVGESVLLNIGSKIDHDCVIEKGSHIPMGCVVRNAKCVPAYSSFISNSVVE